LDYAPEVIAVANGMIPIFNIANSTYSWGNNGTREDGALTFQSDNGNCTIAISQAFWGQFVTTDDAWPESSTVWDNAYADKHLVDTSSRIMMIDVEPPPALFPLLDTKDGTTYGVHGTEEQVANAEAYIASKPKFQFSLPDLRDPDSITPTTIGSMYNVLPTLGTRRITESTYSPTILENNTKVSVNDVIGIRIRVDGDGTAEGGYSYNPETAKAAWPGRDKMYFPIFTAAALALIAENPTDITKYVLAEAEVLEIMNRLVKTSSSSSSKSSSSSSKSSSSSSSSKSSSSSSQTI
jgi:hypothetical protein